MTLFSFGAQEMGMSPGGDKPDQNQIDELRNQRLRAAVVATDAGDVPSLIEDGKAGFVYFEGMM